MADCGCEQEGGGERAGENDCAWDKLEEIVPYGLCGKIRLGMKE
jgi:hypothetical protein